MKKILILIVFLSFFSSLIVSSQVPSKIGWWKFDDPTNLFQASVGSPLGYNGYPSPVAGPSSENGAIRIDKGDYLVINNLPSNSETGNKLNEYSLMIDFAISELDIWRSFFQTDVSNTSDADLFINAVGSIGVASTTYTNSKITPQTWYRMIVSVKNDEFFRIYINGELWLDTRGQSVNGRFALDNALLLFADENEEDGDILCSEVAIWSVALSANQAVTLGGSPGKWNVDRSKMGSWKFDDPSDLLIAEIGSSLELTGTAKPVAGPTIENNAIEVGKGSFLKIKDILKGYKAGSKINEYSVLIDFSIPEENKWYAFFQTDPTNNTDAELFAKDAGNLGVSSTTYSSRFIKSDEWYRMVITVKNDEFYRIYINGELWLDAPGQGVNGRYSIENQLLLFADENGEDGTIYCAEAAVWQVALTYDEVKRLGDITSYAGLLPVKINITGPTRVRLGVPNRYTVSLYNKSDGKTAPFIAAITITDDIEFMQYEISTKTGKTIIPVDSVGSKKDHTELFFVPYLNPFEDYTFDVIVQGIELGTKSTFVDGPKISATGFSKSVAKNAMVDFLVKEISKEVDLDEKETQEYAKGVNLTVEQLNIKKEKEGKGVFALKSVIKYSIETTAKVNPIAKAINAIGEGIDVIAAVKDSFRRRVFYWLYKEVGLYGVDEPVVVSGKTINGVIVASSDPNEKYGNSGYGASNYISEVGRMHYTIKFENKKEATAPAYRVQIIDTLSEVFNPESVIFGSTSHSSANYNWIKVRNGNILKWDIEGIELEPNITPPEGEGYVTFSVELNGSIANGTEIKNRATIIFDKNPAISTNTWENIVDITGPSTVMDPISYNKGDTLITVSCLSEDNIKGSGISHYDFFVSIENEPFVFIGKSYESSIKYSISVNQNKNYRFYAVATDNVGNPELKAPKYNEVNTSSVSSNQVDLVENIISLYPNPAFDIINVKIMARAASQMSYSLYSLDGRVIKQGRYILNQNGQNIFEIDVSSLQKGVYFAKFSTVFNCETFKIIIKEN